MTNLLIAPVQPFILLWGSVGLLVGLVGLAFLAQIVLWVPYLCLVWTVAMVHWTDSWPGGTLVIAGYGIGSLVMTYLLMVILLGRTLARQQWERMRRWMAAMRSRRSKGQSPKSSSISGRVGCGLLTIGGQTTPPPRWIEIGSWIRNERIGNTALGVLGVAGLLIWWMVLTQPDGYLHVHFLDVGQGDAIFVQTSSGRQVLIDGGSDSTRLFSELGEVMPFWDRSLDLLVLTHPDLDHMGAQLSLPQRYRINQAVVSAVTADDADGEQWENVVRAAGVPVAIQGQGGWIDLSDGVALWSLWPPDEAAVRRNGEDKNERSLVQMLVYGDLRVLLTGDAGLPVESALVRNGSPLAAQLLKVGHHGSHSSTGADFVAAVDPLVAVIQVGENRYGHPHPEVLDGLAGRLVLRNDEHGRVHVWSDGRHMWLEAEQADPLQVYGGR